MARRADHTREELVELIIDSAQKMIVELGVEKFSARALSKKIGYAPGTLYHHFEDLDAIVTAVNVKTLSGLAASFAKARDAEPNANTLHVYADVFISYVRNHKHLWNALFEFKRSEDSEVPDWYVAKIDGLIQILTDCFVAIRKDLPIEEAQRASRLLFASVHSVSSLENSGRLELIMNRSIDDVAHELVDIHISAYQAR